MNRLWSGSVGSLTRSEHVQNTPRPSNLEPDGERQLQEELHRFTNGLKSSKVHDDVIKTGQNLLQNRLI